MMVNAGRYYYFFLARVRKHPGQNPVKEMYDPTRRVGSGHAGHGSLKIIKPTRVFRSGRSINPGLTRPYRSTIWRSEKYALLMFSWLPRSEERRVGKECRSR